MNKLNHIEIARKVRNCIKAYNSNMGTDIDPNVRIDFKPLRTCAGKSILNKGNPYLAFNSDMIDANFDEFMRDIVPHEVAHHIIRKKYAYRVKPHGRKWQSICLLIGGSGLAYHSMNVEGTCDMWVYKCACNDRLMVKAIRHNRVMTKGVRYICLKCKGRISYTGEFVPGSRG